MLRSGVGSLSVERIILVSSSNEKDALKKYIAQAKKSYETALEAATKGNPVNFLSEMGRMSAALSMLELEISK